MIPSKRIFIVEKSQALLQLRIKSKVTKGIRLNFPRDFFLTPKLGTFNDKILFKIIRQTTEQSQLSKRN